MKNEDPQRARHVVRFNTIMIKKMRSRPHRVMSTLLCCSIFVQGGENVFRVALVSRPAQHEGEACRGTLTGERQRVPMFFNMCASEVSCSRGVGYEQSMTTCHYSEYIVFYVSPSTLLVSRTVHEVHTVYRYTPVYSVSELDPQHRCDVFSIVAIENHKQ